MRKLAILAASLMMLPAVSQAKTLEELLVEKGVITRSEASKAGMGSGSKVYWNGGTRLEFPDNGFTTQINTQVQTRYTFTDADEKVGNSNRSSFDIVRARLAVSGTALNNEFAYMLQTDLVGDPGLSTGTNDAGSRSPELKDAWIQWNACDWASARMGQFKTAVSRQYNTSSSKLQFADRSIASETFDLGRQGGISGRWSLMDDDLVVSAGMFNGQSTGEGINSGGVDTRQTGIVGLRWAATGEMDAYEEGDVNYTEDMALNFGAAIALAQATNDLAGGDFDFYDLSVDGNYKSHGLSIHGEFYSGQINPDNDSTNITPRGFYTQVGYFLTPKKWEIAARYSLVDCDNGAASIINSTCDNTDKVNEAAAGVNYYWWKHNLKAQFNYVLLDRDFVSSTSESSTTENRWLFQLSSYF
jgi:phosphate-selective porin